MKHDEWPLLPGERRVRFGCGALLGLVVGISLVIRMSTLTWEAALIVAGCAVVLGFASALFGERLWEFLRWW